MSPAAGEVQSRFSQFCVSSSTWIVRGREGGYLVSRPIALCFVLHAVACVVVQLSCGAVITGAAVQPCLALPRKVFPCSMPSSFLCLNTGSAVVVAAETAIATATAAGVSAALCVMCISCGCVIASHMLLKLTLIERGQLRLAVIAMRVIGRQWGSWLWDNLCTA